MFLKCHRFFRWFLKNFWAYQSQNIQKVWKSESWLRSDLLNHRWIQEDEWEAINPLKRHRTLSTSDMSEKCGSDDVDFYVDFPHFLWISKHVGSVGLLTGWKHMRWRGRHTIWYFQHGGGSVNLTCRFITGITWIRIDHVTHFLMCGFWSEAIPPPVNAQMEECKDRVG